MKKMLAVLLIVVIAVAGCAKKPVEKSETIQARQLLAEGTAYLKQAEVLKAVQSFAAAIKVAPDYFESYYLLSETLIHLKQYPQAAAILTSAVKRFPDNGVVYYLLAVAHQNSGNILPAIVASRKSLELLTAQGDKEGQQRAMILLATLLSEAKKLGEEQEAEIVKMNAQKAENAKLNAQKTANAVVLPDKNVEADVENP